MVALLCAIRFFGSTQLTQVTSSGYSHRLRSMEHVFASAKNVHIPPTPQTPESRCIASSMYARTKIVNIPPPTINPISCVAWSMCLQVQATLTSSPHPTRPIPFMSTYYPCSEYTQATANVASAPRVCLMYSTGSGKMKTKSVSRAMANVEPCGNNYSELPAPNNAKG